MSCLGGLKRDDVYKQPLASIPIRCVILEVYQNNYEMSVSNCIYLWKPVLKCIIGCGLRFNMFLGRKENA